MSLLADAIQPFIRSEFFSISGRLDFTNLTDVILAPRIGFDLSFDAADQSMSLDFRDTFSATTALAADYCRFSSAAFQSIACLPLEILDRDTIAWGIVKLYYSAFYAGHAIMRLLGESRSFFDSQHIGKLTALGKAAGNPPSFSLRTGLYCCVVSKDGSILKCKQAKAAVGGIHELFWDNFAISIEGIAAKIVTGPLAAEEAQAVFLKLEAFRKALRKDGAYKRLTNLRNDLQYKHQFDVWFPNNLKKKDRDSLGRLISRWLKEPMDIDVEPHYTEMENFTSCCTFLVALCRTLLERVSERSAAGKRSFVTLGPMKFLKDRQHGHTN